MTFTFPEDSRTLGRGCVDPGQCLSLLPQCLYPLPSGFAESPPAGLIHTLSYRKFYALFKASAAPRSSHTWSVGCTLTFPIPSPDRTHRGGATSWHQCIHTLLFLPVSVCGS